MRRILNVRRTIISGDIKLQTKEDDLLPLIKNCVKELKGLLKLRKCDIILEIDSPLITKFNNAHIQEVVLNLLNNAIKYSPPNTDIVIKSERKNQFIEISIKDKGIGLTKYEKANIFQKFGNFNRERQYLNLNIEGSGLGLYFSKKIIELHGGKIWVESEGRNRGSTFYFTLPIISETHN